MQRHRARMRSLVVPVPGDSLVARPGGADADAASNAELGMDLEL
jgi:hypothetical protein